MMTSNKKSKEYILFSWLELLLFLQKLNPNLDLDRSANMPDYGISTKDGKEVWTPCFSDFLKQVNGLLGLEIEWDRSYRSGGFIYIIAPEQEGITEVQGVLEEVSVTEELGAELSTEEGDVVNSPDWGYVNSLTKLEDKDKAKLELDVYAESFNVKLKRTMKLSNMIKHFKSELAK